MQLKNEDRAYPIVIEPIVNPVETILQPVKRTTIWVKSQIYTDSKATGIILSSTFVNPKQQTCGPNWQFSGPPLHTQEGNTCSEFLDIDS